MKYWELVDETAELFKGEYGDINVLESMSLKELVTRRDIRIKRKMKEIEAEKRRQAEEEKNRVTKDMMKNIGAKAARR